MQIETAKTAGFCFGVKRAVDTVYEHINEEPVYTYGPIIHNETVVQDLKARGVKIIESEEELKEVPAGTVIIRAHGIPEKLYDRIREAGHRIVDATCPFVLKIHNIVKKAVAEGKYVVIIGDSEHPEVQGIRSCGGNRCTVLDNAEEATAFLEQKLNTEEICIVAQTTFNYKKFQELVEIFTKNKYYKVDVLNTICNATQERQQEAGELASRVDAMIVIGGKNSSNTQKLYDICRAACERTFFIQSADELDASSLCGLDKIGITAGASTPEIIIKEVQTKCQI